MDFYKNKVEPIILKNQKTIWIVICVGLFLSAFINYAWIISLLCCFFIKDDEEDNLVK
ncbi:hypothetical protein [uncultured Clostridium sp.]|uniref:hypothetical protein n=1 Tax=uncultured Clostridium sp. TaxID=59620 RepID=UPI0025F626CB|nr:hypothetical protein [uncultured Clostridium sp.]